MPAGNDEPNSPRGERFSQIEPTTTNNQHITVMSAINKQFQIFFWCAIMVVAVVMVVLNNREVALIDRLQTIVLLNDHREKLVTRTFSVNPEEKHETNWRAINVGKLTLESIVEYLYFTNQTACKLTHDFGGVMNSDYSILDGQKSICLDPGIAPIPHNCTVYSFGINSEWSFDDTMEKYGCRVFTFDPTMGIGNHRRSENIYFYDIGLGNGNETKNGWDIQSMSGIYDMLTRSNKHGTDILIDYLKVDIEGDEWIALPNIIASGMIHKVREMGVEIHLPYDQNLDTWRKLVAIIKAVEDTGMIRFDSKYNPYSRTSVPALNYHGPVAFELAWYRVQPKN